MKTVYQLLPLAALVALLVSCKDNKKSDPPPNPSIDKQPAITYTVIFNTHDGSPIKPDTVQSGQLVARPADPTKTEAPFIEKDIRFEGWYADASLKTPFDFDKPIVSDTTLYARYAYLVSSEKQLAAMASNLAGLYRLSDDITLTQEWTPIGNKEKPFIGRFEGGGRVIKNLTIVPNNSAPYLGSAGLFGYVGDSGVVRAVGLENVNIKSTGKAVSSGALAGYNRGEVSGYAIGGKVEGGGTVGGLVGWNVGKVTGYTWVETQGLHTVGGLVGWNIGKEGTDVGIVMGYAVGPVNSVPAQNGNEYLGALVGRNSKGKVMGYARGSVTVGLSGSKTTFGLLVGGSEDAAVDLIKGYHSGNSHESLLNGFATDKKRSESTDGDAIMLSDATNNTSFSSFDAMPSLWKFRKGRWPAISLGGDVSVDAQDAITASTLPAVP